MRLSPLTLALCLLLGSGACDDGRSSDVAQENVHRSAPPSPESIAANEPEAPNREPARPRVTNGPLHDEGDIPAAAARPGASAHERPELALQLGETAAYAFHRHALGDSRFLISDGQSLSIVDGPTGRILTRRADTTRRFEPLGTSRSGRSVLLEDTAAPEEGICVWDTDSQHIRCAPLRPPAQISPGGRQVIGTSLESRELYRWDLRTSRVELLDAPPLSERAEPRLRWSPSGTFLIESDPLRVREAETGRIRWAHLGETLPEGGARPCGGALVSVSEGEIRFRSLRSGDLLRRQSLPFTPTKIFWEEECASLVAYRFDYRGAHAIRFEGERGRQIGRVALRTIEHGFHTPAFHGEGGFDYLEEYESPARNGRSALTLTHDRMRTRRLEGASGGRRIASARGARFTHAAPLSDGIRLSAPDLTIELSTRGISLREHGLLRAELADESEADPALETNLLTEDAFVSVSAPGDPYPISIRARSGEAFLMGTQAIRLRDSAAIACSASIRTDARCFASARSLGEELLVQTPDRFARYSRGGVFLESGALEQCSESSISNEDEAYREAVQNSRTRICCARELSEHPVDSLCDLDAERVGETSLAPSALAGRIHLRGDGALVRTGDSLQVLVPGFGIDEAPNQRFVVAPDGRHVALVRGHRLMLINAEDGERIAQRRLPRSPLALHYNDAGELLVTLRGNPGRTLWLGAQLETLAERERRGFRAESPELDIAVRCERRVLFVETLSRESESRSLGRCYPDAEVTILPEHIVQLRGFDAQISDLRTGASLWVQGGLRIAGSETIPFAAALDERGAAESDGLLPEQLFVRRGRIRFERPRRVRSQEGLVRDYFRRVERSVEHNEEDAERLEEPTPEAEETPATPRRTEAGGRPV